MSDLIQRGDVFKALWARHKHEGMGLDALITMEDALAAVVSIPTVDAVEVKHGQWHGVNTDKKEWTRTDGTPIFLMCSECQNIVINNASAKWNYCPNCGAKMDGGEEDG